MRACAIAIALLACSTIASAQQWHAVSSPFCSQIKAKGARVSYRPFQVFAVPSGCKVLRRLISEIQEQNGAICYSRALEVNSGRYFVIFDLKTSKSSFQSILRVLNLKDCERAMSKVTVDKRTNHLDWDEWVVVD